MVPCGMDTPLKVPLPVGSLDSYVIRDSLGPSELAPKWHLDQFKCFCRAHECDTQTDTQTDHVAPMYSKRPLSLAVTVMQRNNTTLCSEITVLSKSME